MIKIAFLVNQFPTLSETFILDQITGLIDRGHEVDIYAAYLQSFAKSHTDVEKYRLLDRTYYCPQLPAGRFRRLISGMALLLKNWYKNPLPLLRSLNIFRYGKKAASLEIVHQIVPFLDKGPYDIIHCHFGPNGKLALLLKELGLIDGKLLVTFHGYDVNLYPKIYGQEVYKDLFDQAHICFVNSNFIKHKVIALGCPEAKIIKFPVGLKISKFLCKEKVCRPGSEIRVLTVARLVEVKGIEYTIKAVAQVLKKHPQILYQIVGDGPLRESLQALIQELGIEARVKLLGWMKQEEILELYAEADIFILSSITAMTGEQEGQGLVLQEAQAMGLPVISTLYGGIAEGVLDGKSGFLVAERDVMAIAEKLRYLIESPVVRQEMGRIGREYVREHYDIHKLNDQLVKIYENLLTERQ